MKSVLSFAMIFLCLFMYSCQKENSFMDDPEPTTPPQNQNTRLSKLFVIDTTVAIPHDTVGRYYYSYDASNRLSQATTFTTETNGDSSYYTVETFIYNGADSLASMVAKKGRSFNNGVGYATKDTSFYLYNSSGKLIKDSVRVSASNYYRSNYTYISPDHIAENYFRQYPSSTFPSKHQYHPVIMNGNIVSQKDTNLVAIPYGPGLIDSTFFAYNRTATYNQHPDPLSRTTSFRKLDFFNTLPSLGTRSSPVNLMISQDEVSTRFGPAGSVEMYKNNHVDYSYAYRPDGYPTIAREHTILIDIAGSGGTTVSYAKIIFVY